MSCTRGGRRRIESKHRAVVTWRHVAPLSLLVLFPPPLPLSLPRPSWPPSHRTASVTCATHGPRCRRKHSVCANSPILCCGTYLSPINPLPPPARPSLAPSSQVMRHCFPSLPALGPNLKRTHGYGRTPLAPQRPPPLPLPLYFCTGYSSPTTC